MCPLMGICNARSDTFLLMAPFCTDWLKGPDTSLEFKVVFRARATGSENRAVGALSTLPRSPSS